MHIHIHTYIDIYRYTYTHIHIHTYTYINRYPDMHIYIFNHEKKKKISSKLILTKKIQYNSILNLPVGHSAWNTISILFKFNYFF